MLNTINVNKEGICFLGMKNKLDVSVTLGNTCFIMILKRLTLVLFGDSIRIIEHLLCARSEPGHQDANVKYGRPTCCPNIASTLEGPSCNFAFLSSDHCILLNITNSDKALFFLKNGTS